MSERYDDEWVAKLLNAESRLGGTAPRDLLTGAGVRERHVVVDVGCGPGFLTLPAAEIVGPHGHVYAADIEQQMLDLVQNSAADRGLSNVTTVLSTGETVPLPDRTADFAICSLVLHYYEDSVSRVAMLRDLGRLLRPDGRLFIIDRSLGSEEVASLLREAQLEYGEPQPLEEDAYKIIASRPTVAPE